MTSKVEVGWVECNEPHQIGRLPAPVWQEFWQLDKSPKRKRGAVSMVSPLAIRAFDCAGRQWRLRRCDCVFSDG